MAALLPPPARRAAPEHGSSPPRWSARWGSPDSEPKTRDYLERLEAGELEPRGLSGRLLDGLARLLEVPRTALEGAGGFGAPARARALFRAEGPRAGSARDDLDVLADALAAPGGGWDEVDELFRGGER